MKPVLLDGPAIEPLSLAEAKVWLKVDGPEDDDLIRALIVAARLMVEAEIGQVLVAQNWRLIGDRWPPGERIIVRPGPILSVLGGRIFEVSGQAVSLPASNFTALSGEEGAAIIPRERPAPGRLYGGIEIDLRLGYGEGIASVPENVRLAIRRLVALWYDNRGERQEPGQGLPPQIRALLRPFRRLRL